MMEKKILIIVARADLALIAACKVLVILLAATAAALLLWKSICYIRRNGTNKTHCTHNTHRPRHPAVYPRPEGRRISD
jgi:hypothetical protein